MSGMIPAVVLFFQNDSYHLDHSSWEHMVEWLCIKSFTTQPISCTYAYDIIHEVRFTYIYIYVGCMGSLVLYQMMERELKGYVMVSSLETHLYKTLIPTRSC